MSWSIFSPKTWSIHNPLKAWTLHDLTEGELRLIAKTLSTAEINVSLIWKKGWANWEQFAQGQFDSLRTSQTSERHQAPPVPSNTLGSHDDEITQVRPIHKEPMKVKTDRRHARRAIVVSAEIIQGRNSFQTETLDVSESGLRFKDNIPDWVAGYFTVIIKTGIEVYEITCALVEDQKNSKDKAEVVDTNDEESGLPKFVAWVRTLPETYQTQF